MVTCTQPDKRHREENVLVHVRNRTRKIESAMYEYKVNVLLELRAPVEKFLDYLSHQRNFSDKIKSQ